MFIYLAKVSGNKLNGMHPISAFDKKPKSKKGTYYFHITRWQKQKDCFFLCQIQFLNTLIDVSNGIGHLIHVHIPIMQLIIKTIRIYMKNIAINLIFILSQIY